MSLVGYSPSDGSWTTWLCWPLHQVVNFTNSKIFQVQLDTLSDKGVNGNGLAHCVTTSCGKYKTITSCVQNFPTAEKTYEVLNSEVCKFVIENGCRPWINYTIIAAAGVGVGVTAERAVKAWKRNDYLNCATYAIVSAVFANVAFQSLNAIV